MEIWLSKSKPIKKSSQNKRNLFDFFWKIYSQNNPKLKKDTEIYIKENSKKFLGGYADGKNDKRIQKKNVS